MAIDETRNVTGPAEARAQGADTSGEFRNLRRSEMNELARKVAEQFSSDVVSPGLIAGFARLSEFTYITFTGMVIYWLYVVDRANGASALSYGQVSLAGAILTLIAIQAIDGYHLETFKNRLKQFSKPAVGIAVAMIVLLTAGFFLKVSHEFSRIWFASWATSSLAGIIVFRLLLSAYINRLTADGRLERRAVIVGGGEPASLLIRQLESQPNSDVRICGIFDDRTDDRSPAMVSGYPKLGTIDELVAFGRMARIDMLIVTLPLSAEERVLQMLKRLWVLPVDIRMSAHSNKLRFRPRSYSYEGTVPFLDVFERPIADWDAVTKRTFDIIAASILIVLLTPLMLATAAAIKLNSKGPVLFRQKRFGFNNEVIDVMKFRSMYHEMSDPDAKQVVTRGDPRVTRVGKFIRKTSIDELPQLFNVLLGDLSLVGPRPHAVYAHTHNRLWEEVVDGYFARHRVKPGVTGWAQVNGWRGEVDDEEKIRQRVNHDLYYIENWSLLFDIQILLLTPISLIKTENAY